MRRNVYCFVIFIFFRHVLGRKTENYLDVSCMELREVFENDDDDKEWVITPKPGDLFS